MKLTKYSLAFFGIATLVLIYAYFSGFIGGEVKVGQRPPIDPSLFTREEALANLARLEPPALADLRNSSTKKSLAFSDLPDEIAKLVIPAEGEGVTAEIDTNYDEIYDEIYHVSYFSGLALPDSHSYLIKAALRNDFHLVNGSRNALASTFDVSSPNYEITISQLAKSEERTEVMILARAKNLSAFPDSNR